MRTTLTLDDDVAAKIKANARRTGRPFKEVVNAAIRLGLTLESQTKRLTPFEIDSQDVLHLKPGPNYDKVEQLFDELDGPNRLR